MNGLPQPAYVMREPHLSGYRVIIGYETLADAQAAHGALAARSSEPGGGAIIKAICEHCQRATVVPAETIALATTPHPGASSPQDGGGERELDALDHELIERDLRTIRAYDAVRILRDALSATTARLSNYDWNADPDGLTKQQGDAFAVADRVFADLNAAVEAHDDPTDQEWEAALSTPPASDQSDGEEG